jgi:hypothetical protein
MAAGAMRLLDRRESGPVRPLTLAGILPSERR